MFWSRRSFNIGGGDEKTWMTTQNQQKSNAKNIFNYGIEFPTLPESLFMVRGEGLLYQFIVRSTYRCKSCYDIEQPVDLIIV